MFWRAMEGLLERETPEGERNGEHKRERQRRSERGERRDWKETNTKVREKEINKKL